MKNLVRRIGTRVVCDMYTCNNMAEFSIGHEYTPSLATHLCKDCMKAVFEEARNIFSEDYAAEQRRQRGIDIAEEEQPAGENKEKNEAEEKIQKSTSSGRSWSTVKGRTGK